MSELLDALTRFYGLDWATMLLGLGGTYLLARQDKRGFLCNGMACVCGLCVAALSGQMGFIAYNIILICMMYKGFISWGRSGKTVA